MLDLILPQACAGCGAHGALLCPRCGMTLAQEPRPRQPRPSPPSLPEPWSAGEYSGPLRAMIVAYKERGRTPLSRPFGHCLARVVKAGLVARGIEEVSLVPVPSARSARRNRGHDPVGAMAAVAVRALAHEGIVARVLPALRQRVRVADQAGLDAGQRAANLAGAFEARVVPQGALVVVDDVVTTGSTLAEAARALRPGRVIFAATLGATPRYGYKVINSK